MQGSQKIPVHSLILHFLSRAPLLTIPFLRVQTYQNELSKVYIYVAQNTTSFLQATIILQHN